MPPFQCTYCFIISCSSHYNDHTSDYGYPVVSRTSSIRFGRENLSVDEITSGVNKTTCVGESSP